MRCTEFINVLQDFLKRTAIVTEGKGHAMESPENIKFTVLPPTMHFTVNNKET